MIVYIVVLVVLIIVFFCIGYFTYNQDTPSETNMDFQDLLKTYQNYGQLINVDTSESQLISLGLGTNSNGLLSPIIPRLDPAYNIDPYDRQDTYTCYYPDQIVAQRKRDICTEKTCFPNFNLGDIHEYYVLDKNAVPCGNTGSSMGLIVVSDFGGQDTSLGGCLDYTTSSDVGISICDPTNEKQLWSIERVDPTGNLSMNGIYGSIRPRGITGYLAPTVVGATGSNLEIVTSSGFTGHNWLFTTVQPYVYGPVGNQTEVTIPTQYVWVGPNFDKSSTLDTIKKEIQSYFSISTDGVKGSAKASMQTFYLPNEDPPKTNQKTSYVDYTIYNYIKTHPELL